MATPPTRASDRGPGGNGGFTMIEVMIALMLITVVLTSVARVFYGSLRTAGISNLRTSASVLATKETEFVHAIAYDHVGFYTDQPGYASTFESHNTVTLAGSAPTGTRLTPTTTFTVGPKTYNVGLYLTWVDAQPGLTTLTEAYKKTTVVVTWTDVAGAHTVRQDSVFYPGALGAYAGAGSGTTTTTAPTTTTTTSGTTTTTTTTIPVTTTTSTTVPATTTTTLPCSPNNYSVVENGSGLTTVHLKATGKTENDLNVAVTVVPSCATYTVRVYLQSNSSQDTATITLSGTSNLTGNLSKNTDWAAGIHVFQLQRNGVDVGSGFLGTILACANNAAPGVGGC